MIAEWRRSTNPFVGCDTNDRASILDDIFDVASGWWRLFEGQREADLSIGSCSIWIWSSAFARFQLWMRRIRGPSKNFLQEEWGLERIPGRRRRSRERLLSDFLYSSCYCEENVYMLCKKLSELGLAAPDASDLFVIFVSNSNRQIPIWRQRTSKDVAGLCIWDYRVICIQMVLCTTLRSL